MKQLTSPFCVTGGMIAANFSHYDASGSIDKSKTSTTGRRRSAADRSLTGHMCMGTIRACHDQLPSHTLKYLST